MKIVPFRALKTVIGGRGAHSGDLVKHYLLRKAWPRVKHTFGNIAKTRAVREGELLRGMVSQGRLDPLRHSFKVLRSDSAKIKAKL